MIEMDQIKADEGFRALPYHCPAGKLTIGYGLNLDAGISQLEAELLLRVRLDELLAKLHTRIPLFGRFPEHVQGVLLNMAYQMGVDGLAKFKDMLAALQRNDWPAAADAMLNSKWALQTPARAKRLADRVRVTR